MNRSLRLNNLDNFEADADGGYSRIKGTVKYDTNELSEASISGAGSGPGNGGDGVVFLRVATSDYPGAGNVSGKTTITTDGSDTIIKWTTSGGYLA